MKRAQKDELTKRAPSGAVPLTDYCTSTVLFLRSLDRSVLFPPEMLTLLFSPLPLRLTDSGGNDAAYYGQLGIGTPAQEFSTSFPPFLSLVSTLCCHSSVHWKQADPPIVADVIFDTGSADLWVPSSKSSTSHTKFSSSASSTVETSTAEWDITYGSSLAPSLPRPNRTPCCSPTFFPPHRASTEIDKPFPFLGTGSSEGFLARDTVTAGGYTVSQQIFALADSSASVVDSLPSDGICGMAFSTIATSGAPTFFENLITAGSVSQSVFGWAPLRAKAYTSKSKGTIAGGELCIGCIDSSKYTGNLFVVFFSPSTWDVCSPLSSFQQLCSGRIQVLLVGSERRCFHRRFRRLWHLDARRYRHRNDPHLRPYLCR
jgi:hypothetical protein